IGIAILCGLQVDWNKVVVIVYIIIAQGFSGVAKDQIKITVAGHCGFTGGQVSLIYKINDLRA
ncbi:14126_t:CDS:1, partial [Entrophospora sp. SA101]